MRTKDIKIWLYERDIALVEIAKEARASKSLVSKAIRGERMTGEKAKRVIEALRRRGCPAELLGDVGYIKSI